MIKTSAIAFKPEEATDALKEFIGQIVETDYSLEPFNMKGAPEIERKTKVLAVMIRTATYDKPQYEWYPPSKVKKTKLMVDEEYDGTYRIGMLHISVKWLYFIEALNAVGAMKDVSVAGATDDERMKNFARSLLGMKFRFQEMECESLVKLRGGEVKKFSVLLPVEYLGKLQIEAVPEVKQATIGEAVGEAAPEL